VSVRSLRRGAVAASRLAAPTTVTVLTLTGDGGNYASTPDSAALSVTGDIDLRVKAALPDWTPDSGSKALLAKGGSGNQSYDMYVNGDGSLRLVSSVNGSTTNWVNGTTATGFVNGTAHWVRATRTASNGEVKFYVSEDGITWTQLGATTGNTAGNIFNSTAELRVGLSGWSDSPLPGTVYYAEVRNGIGGPVVGKFDPAGVTILGTRNPTSFVSATGETWTMTGSAWNWATV
jgi:hypothetical protein